MFVRAFGFLVDFSDFRLLHKNLRPLPFLFEAWPHVGRVGMRKEEKLL